MNGPTVTCWVVDDGRWHHIVHTKIGGVWKLYVDGNLVSTIKETAEPGWCQP